MYEELDINKFDKNKKYIYQSSETSIFETTNLETKKQVLVKLPSKKFPSAYVIENYKKEHQYAKLLHDTFPENFVEIHELIETETSIAIVQEPEFQSLEDLLAKKGVFELKEFLKLSIDMCDSLSKLHSLNMIHRDIKPGNFVLTEENKPKLIDFGITVMFSRKTPSVTCTHPTGTYYYMR
jgi:serine/threonine protein kinase